MVGEVYKPERINEGRIKLGETQTRGSEIYCAIKMIFQ